MVLVVITVDWNQCASTLTQGMISSSGSQRRKKKKSRTHRQPDRIPLWNQQTI